MRTVYYKCRHKVKKNPLYSAAFERNLPKTPRRGFSPPRRLPDRAERRSRPQCSVVLRCGPSGGPAAPPRPPRASRTKKGAVSKQEFYSIFVENRAKKVPETCLICKFPELFSGYILGKIYFETAPFCVNRGLLVLHQGRSLLHVRIQHHFDMLECQLVGRTFIACPNGFINGAVLLKAFFTHALKIRCSI